MLQCLPVQQRAAVCCGVLQCVVACCSVLQCVETCCNVLRGCYSVLQCVVVFAVIVILFSEMCNKQQPALGPSFQSQPSSHQSFSFSIPSEWLSWIEICTYFPILLPLPPTPPTTGIIMSRSRITFESQEGKLLIQRSQKPRCITIGMHALVHCPCSRSHFNLFCLVVTLTTEKIEMQRCLRLQHPLPGGNTDRMAYLSGLFLQISH